LIASARMNAAALAKQKSAEALAAAQPDDR
jgi:hypothetical protein